MGAFVMGNKIKTYPWEMLLIGCYLKVYENELTPCYTRFYLNTIKKTYIVFFFLQPLTTNRAVSPNNGRRRTLRSTKRY